MNALLALETLRTICLVTQCLVLKEQIHEPQM